MCKSHKKKEIIWTDICDHVFLKEFEKTLNFKEFNNRIVIEDLSSLDFDGNSVKAFQDILEVWLLYKRKCTSKSS